MATFETFELYNFEVCLENMLDRNPRLLSCHHSFCMDCLKKLLKQGVIMCPTCRKDTVVPNNDPNALSVNFMLQKFKKHSERMLCSKGTLCQFCSLQDATLKCQECVQFICGDCKFQHDKVKTFKHHTIYKLCQKHIEGLITHLCMTCTQPVCAKCVVKDHSGCDGVKTLYEDGIKELSTKMTKYEKQLSDTLEASNVYTEQHQKKMVTLDKAIAKVEDIKQYHIEKTKNAAKTLDTLQQIKLELIKANEEHLMNVKECQSMMDRIKTRENEIKMGILKSISGFREQIDRISECMNDNIGYNLPDVQIEDPRIGKDIHLLVDKKRDVYLDKIVLIKQVNSRGGWSQPYNISNCDRDCVLISDRGRDYITLASSSDVDPVRITASHGTVRDAVVYQGHLYTAYKDCISGRTFKDGVTGDETILKKNINDTYSMVINDLRIYLLSYNQNKIVEYNLNTQAITEVITNLNIPVNVSLINHDDHVMYCVTCWGSHSVNVYDDNWRLMFTLGGRGSGDGQLRHPDGTTCTTEGILVADYSNRRISQFTFEGKFMKHILTREDGFGYPLAISFNSPYLWMTQSGPYAVKCFKLCE